MGGALDDGRLETAPPYQHLPARSAPVPFG